MSLLTVVVVCFVAGLIAGMNPTLIGTTTSYISSMIGRRVNNTRYSLFGLAFLLYFYLVLAFLAALVAFITSLFSLHDQFGIAIAAGLSTVATGLVLIKRYFWHENPPKFNKDVYSYLHSSSTKGKGIINLIKLAHALFFATLPTLGLLTITVAIIGELVGPAAYAWCLPFALGLITPSYFVLTLLSSKTRPSSIIEWKEHTKSTMRLYNGLAMIAIVWLMFYVFAGGVVVG